jgi:hypothetical protein
MEVRSFMILPLYTNGTAPITQTIGGWMGPGVDIEVFETEKCLDAMVSRRAAF